MAARTQNKPDNRREISGADIGYAGLAVAKLADLTEFAFENNKGLSFRKMASCEATYIERYNFRAGIE